MKGLNIFGLTGIPEIKKGDHLPSLIIESLESNNEELVDGDVVIVTSKIISKAENQVIKIEDVVPSFFAKNLAESTDRDPRQIEIILNESLMPIKISKQALIMETHHGFICANAGVDESNVTKGEVLILPEDSDISATKIRKYLEEFYHVKVAVIVADTFGRPWRMGQTNVAIGVSGMLPLIDYSGKKDVFGRELKSTHIAIADILAGTAELVMGKTDEIPACVIRGYSFTRGDGNSGELVRPKNKDLFR